jgi:hypothetical protein
VPGAGPRASPRSRSTSLPGRTRQPQRRRQTGRTCEVSSASDPVPQIASTGTGASGNEGGARWWTVPDHDRADAAQVASRFRSETASPRLGQQPGAPGERTGATSSQPHPPRPQRPIIPALCRSARAADRPRASAPRYPDRGVRARGREYGFGRGSPLTVGFLQGQSAYEPGPGSPAGLRGARFQAVFARSSYVEIGWNLWGFLPHFLPQQTGLRQLRGDWFAFP